MVKNRAMIDLFCLLALRVPNLELFQPCNGLLPSLSTVTTWVTWQNSAYEGYFSHIVTWCPTNRCSGSICVLWQSQQLVFEQLLLFSCSVCLTLCDPMDWSMPGFPVLHHFLGLLKLMPIELVMPSNHLILCHPLLLLPSTFPSIRVFSNESVLIRWPMYQSFSFSISPSNEDSGLIFFRIHWFDLLAVQGTLKNLL